jgi:hypothetical protein
MKEYIERGKILDQAYYHSLSRESIYDAYGVDAVDEDDIKAIPAADVVEVRHGRWLPDYDYTEYDFDGSTPLPEPRKFQDGWQCSLCGQYDPSETKYCPNCGAKMDGGADDEQ